MPWTIYCHIHIDSGRRYIGLTSQTMGERWNQHVSKSKYSKNGRWHFPNAIRQYGKDAFLHEVLEVCETLESANEAEAKWIDHFDSRNPERGFNLAKGGEHTPHPIKNPWDDPEYKRKNLPRVLERNASYDIRKSISRKLTGRKLSQQHIEKMRDNGRLRGTTALKAARSALSMKPRKTCCKHGHSLENAIVRKNKKRVCRECNKLKNKLKIVTKEQRKKYYIYGREKYLDQMRDSYRSLKLEVFKHYSREMPVCYVCGDDNIDSLRIDCEDGTELRKKHGKGKNFLYWIRKNNFPFGFYVVCKKHMKIRNYHPGIN